MLETNFALFTAKEINIICTVITHNVEFAAYKSVQRDFKDDPLSWNEYINILINSKDTLNLLRRAVDWAAFDCSIDKICFGKALKQICGSKDKADHAPANEQQIINCAPLFNEAEGANFVTSFVSKAEDAYFQYIYKAKYPQANAADFLRALKKSFNMQLEIRNSVQIHLAHLDYSSFFFQENQSATPIG